AAPTVTPISAAICGSSESAARTIAWLEKPASASSAMARVGVWDAVVVGTDGRFVDKGRTRQFLYRASACSGEIESIHPARPRESGDPGPRKERSGFPLARE